ncbi:MAG: hypothetical protein LBQ74_14170 [Prevotella sp.]|jgi:hypothetical protein|nr:hypothetical protein [Prevotella sp.]
MKQIHSLKLESTRNGYSIYTPVVKEGDRYFLCRPVTFSRAVTVEDIDAKAVVKAGEIAPEYYNDYGIVIEKPAPVPKIKVPEPRESGRVLLKGIKRTAAYYQCSVQMIQDLVNNRVIPSYRLGRNRYFYSDEIDAALREN